MQSNVLKNVLKYSKISLRPMLAPRYGSDMVVTDIIPKSCMAHQTFSSRPLIRVIDFSKNITFMGLAIVSDYIT